MINTSCLSTILPYNSITSCLTPSPEDPDPLPLVDQKNDFETIRVLIDSHRSSGPTWRSSWSSSARTWTSSPSRSLERKAARAGPAPETPKRDGVCLCLLGRPRRQSSVVVELCVFFSKSYMFCINMLHLNFKSGTASFSCCHVVSARSDVMDLTHTYNHARLGEEAGEEPLGGHGIYY